jgi:capsular exopolysaccharide synthesis family protein
MGAQGRRGDEMTNNEQGSASLEQILELLRRHARLLAACLLFAAGAAYAYSRHEVKQYTATASLVFNNEGLAQQAAGLPVVGSNDQPAQQNTNLKLVELGDTALRTAQHLGHGMTKQQVAESVSVSAPGESNIANVAATATSPVVAANLANTYASQFVEEQQNSSSSYYGSALRLVNKELSSLSEAERSGTTGRVLQEREQSLRILARLPAGVRLAQAAPVPTAPSSPSAMRNTLVGALLGLALGFGFCFLFERFDRRIKDPKELEALYGLPLLGVVPAGAVTPASSTSRGQYLVSSPEAVEAFQLIRARLRYFNAEQTLQTMMVASGGSGDGKTTIAMNLARAAALMGSRVLLVEVDMRRPTIAGRLGLRAGPGLADVLIGAVSLSEATQTLPLTPPSSASTDSVLDVVSAGAIPPPMPGLLIESQRMGALLEEAKLEYDLVILDPPELNSVSDAFPLLQMVDGVIIVSHSESNSRDVGDLKETLLGTGAPLLGVVANGFAPARPNAYRQGYLSTPLPTAERAPATAPVTRRRPRPAASTVEQSSA